MRTTHRRVATVAPAAVASTVVALSAGCIAETGVKRGSI
jgi:hypothetical protein